MDYLKGTDEFRVRVPVIPVPIAVVWFLTAAANPAEMISTVAGKGIEDFSGDGGPTTRASPNFPPGVPVDGAGNLFITCQSDQRIRKINLPGLLPR